MRRILAGVSFVAALIAALTGWSTEVREAGAAGVASRFVPVAPVRVLDTRDRGAKAAPGATLVDLGGFIPPSATAVAVNATVTEPAAAGYLTLAPAGLQPPLASNLNFTAGETTANAAIVAVTAGRLQFVVTTPAHVVNDLSGYWEGGQLTASAGRFVAVNPVRVLDTRDGGGMVSGAGRAIGVGAAGVPADAVAVAVTFTATAGTDGGYLSAWGPGSAPYVSTLNFRRGETIANFAIVPVDGASGQATIRVLAAAPTHLIVDVAGWFTGPSAPAASAGLFVAAPPLRVLDTRDGTGRQRPRDDLDCADFQSWAEANEVFWTYHGYGDPYRLDGDNDNIPCEALPGSPRRYLVAANTNAAVPRNGTIRSGDPRAPFDAKAIAANLTVTAPAGAGFLTAYPAGRGRPWASNVNPTFPNQTRPSLTITATGDDGQVAIYTSTRAHVVLDAAGWFIG
jgi:hypothetical protein